MKKKGPLCWNACYIEVDILKLPFSAKHCIGRYSSEEQENLNSFDKIYWNTNQTGIKGGSTPATLRREPSKGLVSQFVSSKREIGLLGSFSLLLTAQISALTVFYTVLSWNALFVAKIWILRYDEPKKMGNLRCELKPQFMPIWHKPFFEEQLGTNSLNSKFSCLFKVIVGRKQMQ